MRNRPVFVVDSDDVILRLPEKYLSPFLKDLKNDFMQKKEYLKYLLINSKLIKVCKCGKIAHSYCTTAFVLRRVKIYCVDCDDYFRLFVKNEQIF